MEMNIINLQWAEFKDTPKIKVKKWCSRLVHFAEISLQQLKMVLMVRSSHVGYIVFTSWTHMNATTKSLLRVGKLEIFFKPRVSELGTCQWKNVSDAMDAAKD